MITRDDIQKGLTDAEALILTVYGEARGESPDGQIAVMQVIFNRSIAQAKTIKSICFAPLQFSCWNENDPNYHILTEIAQNIIIGDNIPNNRSYEQIKFLVTGFLEAKFINLIGNAQNYMTTALYLSNRKPAWANAPKHSKIIGSHIFLTL